MKKNTENLWNKAVAKTIAKENPIIRLDDFAKTLKEEGCDCTDVKIIIDPEKLRDMIEYLADQKAPYMHSNYKRPNGEYMCYGAVVSVEVKITV